MGRLYGQDDENEIDEDDPDFDPYEDDESDD